MFEVVARDGFARIGVWGPEGGLSTPAVASVHTARLRAPAAAPLLLSDGSAPLDRPWIRSRGTAFGRAPDAAAGAPLLIDVPRHFAYPPSLTAASGTAAREANERTPAPVHVAAEPAGVPRGAPVVVLPNLSAALPDPRLAARLLVSTRAAAGPASLLYAPGAATPTNLAVLAYAGVDLFDDAGSLLAARRGVYQRPEGPLPVADLSEFPCSCPACAAGTVRGYEGLVAHDREALRRELAEVREAIRRGDLRGLVEARIRASPELVGLLRLFDLEHHAAFEAAAPVLRRGTLFVNSTESLSRPEIRRFRRRLAERYEPPPSARVLVLVPCSHRKPYSDSRTHKAIHHALAGVPNRSAVHKVVVTSPLGVVPAELELSFPSQQYDLPVTGHWDGDEVAFIREAVAGLVAKGTYDRVFVHLNEKERAIVEPVVGPHEVTAADGDPLSPASLALLRDRAIERAAAAKRVEKGIRHWEDMRSRAIFQFGPPGRLLLEGAEVRGLYPTLKIVSRGEQLAQIVPERGLLSLTLGGARRLAAAGCHRVEIDDFTPRGTVFAVGVLDATDDFRVEDEVVLTHKGAVRGVGKALMTGAEMRDLSRGAAVAVRHHG
ncbi:MAG: archaeosine synthase subunit alpha [Methanobacteriota archaeon]